MEEMKAGNYKEIELLRGFAILAVIMIHITGRSMHIKEVNSMTMLFRTVLAASEFAVPLFFIISGFTLSIKHYHEFTPTYFYQKRLKNIISPYLIFSIIYILFDYVHFNVPLGNLQSIFTKILTARASIQLWYFRIIFQFYLVYPFMTRILCKFQNRLLMLLAASLMIQIIWVCYCNSINNLLAQYINPSFVVYVSYHSLFSYIFFFMFGIYIFHNYDKLHVICRTKRFNLYTVTSIIILAFIKSYFLILDQRIQKFSLIQNLTIFYIVAVTILLLKICNDLKLKNNLFARVLFVLGQYSFGIYLIHLLIMLTTERILAYYANVYSYKWHYYPICYLITAGLSLPATYLISLLPYHELLIGKVRRWKLSD